MSFIRRRLPLIIALTAGALLAVVIFSQADRGEALTRQAGSGSPHPQPPAEPEAKRTRLPRPARLAPGQTRGSGQRAETQTTGTASDPPPAADAQAVAAIKENASLAADDIKTCLEGWWEQDPTLSGRVVISFDLTPDGLSDAWIEEHSDVPLGPLSCFSAAIYDQDWTGIVESDTTVTYPFVFENRTDDEEPTKGEL